MRRSVALMPVVLILWLSSCSTLESVGSLFMSSEKIILRITTALSASRYSEAALWAERLGDSKQQVQWRKAVSDYRKIGEGLKALETWRESWTLEDGNQKLQATSKLIEGLPDEVNRDAFQKRLNELVIARDLGLVKMMDSRLVLADWEGFDALVSQISGMQPAFHNHQKLAEYRAQSQQRTAKAKQFTDEAKKLETAADVSASASRSMATVSERVNAWGSARNQYQSALETWRKAVQQGQESASIDIRRVTGKMQAAQQAAENEVRALTDGFYSQLGAQFAKVPAGGIPDNWNEADIVALLSDSQARITKLLSDARTTADQYPDLVDQGTIAKFDRQSQVFLSRLETTRKAMKSAPVVSGQSSVIPVMVGMFNPNTVHADRSRPVEFKGTVKAKPEWWWGLHDIPRETFQDLVVTLKDDRQLGVWPRHYSSSDSKPARDLVSTDKKFSRSWPVLNAGSKLTGGVYHLEIMPDAAPSYSGDVTIYKSFLTRER